MWMNERIGCGYAATIPLSMVGSTGHAEQRDISAFRAGHPNAVTLGDDTRFRCYNDRIWIWRVLAALVILLESLLTVGVATSMVRRQLRLNSNAVTA